jgi:hypothetical protein
MRFQRDPASAATVGPGRALRAALWARPGQLPADKRGRTEGDNIVNRTRAAFVGLDDDGGHARAQFPGDAVDEICVHRGHHCIGAEAAGCRSFPAISFVQVSLLDVKEIPANGSSN